MQHVAVRMRDLLMYMAVEDGDVAERPQQGDRIRSVRREPVPVALQVEERPMRQNHERRLRVVGFEIGSQPIELGFAERTLGIGYIVESDEMKVLVVEALIERAESLLKRRAAIGTGIMLAGQVDVVLGRE